MKDGFVFQVWPYAACTLFAVSFALRCVFTPDRIGTSVPKVFDEAEGAGAARILCWSISLLLLGHLAGLLFPHEVIRWNSVPARLYTLEAIAFAAGLAALSAAAILMWRYLGQSSGTLLGQIADTIFLSLLFVILLSGLLTAILYRWGSSWGVLTLTPYVVSLLRGAPAPSLANGLPFLAQLHVFSAFCALALLPATRVAPVMIAVLARALNGVLGVLETATGPARKSLEAAFRKHNPTAWIWPEEE